MSGKQQGEHRWTARPWVARGLHAGAVLVPIAVSVAITLSIAYRVPQPAGALGEVAWWLGLAGVSTLVLLVVDLLARRLLPLAVLFRLSLVFPDQAPSRFRLAFRSHTVAQLERRLAEAESGDGDLARALETALSLVAALSRHDRRTRGHSERVRAFTDLLAEELNLDGDEADKLRWAALLHDVGKLSVSGAILNKPGKLTAEEWEEIERHPEEGERLLGPVAAWLGPWARAVGEHHEKLDGTGYPRNLRGDQISWSARIVTVADCFEVMTAARSYKRPMSPAAARRELIRCAGTHFDPHVVRAFLNVSMGRLRLVLGPVAWLAQLPLLGGVARAGAGSAAVGGVPATLAGSWPAVLTLAVGGVLSLGGVDLAPTRAPELVRVASGGPASAGATTEEIVAGVQRPDEQPAVLSAPPASPPADIPSTNVPLGGPVAPGAPVVGSSPPPVGTPPPTAPPASTTPPAASAPAAAAPGPVAAPAPLLSKPPGVRIPVTFPPTPGLPPPPPGDDDDDCRRGRGLDLGRGIGHDRHDDDCHADDDDD